MVCLGFKPEAAGDEEGKIKMNPLSYGPINVGFKYELNLW